MKICHCERVIGAIVGIICKKHLNIFVKYFIIISNCSVEKIRKERAYEA